MTFYAILGIPPNADEETIRIAYRALARRYHPDVGEGSSSEKFREVVDAYETLSDPKRRRIYDVTLGRSQSRAVRIEPLAPETPFRSAMHEYVAEQDLFSPTSHLASYMDTIFGDLIGVLDDDLFLFGSRWRW